MNIQCKQILAEAEDSLREFEQKVSEMRSRGETLQPNQLFTQELLKLQVHTSLPCGLVLLQQLQLLISCRSFDLLLDLVFCCAGCLWRASGDGGVQAEWAEPEFGSKGSVWESFTRPGRSAGHRPGQNGCWSEDESGISDWGSDSPR